MGSLGCSLSLQWHYLAHQPIILSRNYFLVGPSLVNNFQPTSGGKISALMLLIMQQKKQTSCPSSIYTFSLWILSIEQWNQNTADILFLLQLENHISFNQPVKYKLIPPEPSSGVRGCLLACEDQQVRTSFPGACDKEKSVSLYGLCTSASVLCEWWVACHIWHRATPETQTFAELINQAM